MPRKIWQRLFGVPIGNRIICSLRKLFGYGGFDRIQDYKIRPLTGDFYVEYLSRYGEIRMQSIMAKHLIYKKGRYFIYGWCDRFPCYRAVPVEKIKIMADLDTDELIPPADIIPWLTNRSCH